MKFLPVSVSPLLTANVIDDEVKPAADAVSVMVALVPGKLSFVVVLSKTYAPPAPDVAVAGGALLQPLVQVMVAPTIGGFPAALLFTVPPTDVALPSVKVVCAWYPEAWPIAVKWKCVPRSAMSGAKL